MTRVAGLANGIYRRAKYLLFTITPARTLLLIATWNGERSLVVVDAIRSTALFHWREKVGYRRRARRFITDDYRKVGINCFHYFPLRRNYLKYGYFTKVIYSYFFNLIYLLIRAYTDCNILVKN